MLTPSQYSARYLPVMVPGDADDFPVHISRYRIGLDSGDKERLQGALADHLAAQKKKNPGYQLTLRINGEAFSIGNWREVGLQTYRPFIGKGSPEECQLVLQLANRLLGIRPERLQAWADANLGLDCNGFVGNYLFHDVMSNDWRVEPGDKDPGPSALINVIFDWAIKQAQAVVIDDPSQVSLTLKYLVVRVDSSGKVMPGGPGNAVGHIAVTEPGQVMQHSFVSDSLGGIDPTFAQLGMYDHFALRTVESVGPNTGDLGLTMNWLVLVQKDNRLPKVFGVRRPKFYRMLDSVKIVSVTASASKAGS